MDSYESNNTLTTLLLSNVTGSDKDGLKTVDMKKINMFKIIFILICMLGITGNVITILALSKSKKLRNSTTAFIINLCVSDMLYCFFFLLNYLNQRWNHNPIYCRFFPVARFGVGYVSAYTIVAITINRYVCVVYPLFYRRLYQAKNLVMMITIIWIGTAIQCLLPSFDLLGRYALDHKVGFCTFLKLKKKSPGYYVFTSVFIFPTLTFAICYPRIFWIVRKASNRVFTPTALSPKTPPITPVALNTSTSLSESRNTGFDTSKKAFSFSAADRQNDKENRVLKVMLVVTICFIFANFPISFIKMFEFEADIPGWLVLISFLMFILSNAINPIIYVAMSAEYRVAYKDLFHSIKTLGNSSTSELISA